MAPVAAGYLAVYFFWQLPFILFTIPTFILVLFALRLQEPVRGIHEREAMGADEKTANTEEAPASFGAAWRICWSVRSLRRVWLATPIYGIPIFALRPLFQIFYADEMGLNAAQRGLLDAVAEPFQLVGLFIGVPIVMKLLKKDAGMVAKMIGVLLACYAVTMLLIVTTKSIPVIVVSRIILSLSFSMITPGIWLLFSLIIPPRVRSIGFTLISVFQIPIFLVGPIIGSLADRIGLAPAIMLLGPVLVVGGIVIWTSGAYVASDVNKVRTSTTAMAEVRRLRLEGKSKLLLVKNLDVSYTGIQVLFDVDFEVDEGEIVALLGTNGAGKSTLLKAISGLVENDAGAIIFDGADMTYAPPNDVVAHGIVQVPGGKGIFPGLSVAENLRIAGWIYRRDDDYVRDATRRVLEYFPVLRERWDQAAGNLSGGEQQMLTLGMAFIAKPRLLMIDELSLGLAPIIVEQLLEIVKAIRAQGTTIILVEQSVNIALTVAETAYFMEKGEIKFHGPTAELLERPDILRSVFLEGAGSLADGANGEKKTKTPAQVRRERQLADGETKGAPILEAIELSKSYGGVKAVNGVSMTLHEGEILGVIGPNGAGKTTLFDLVSGFVLPDGGQLLFDDYDITNYSPDARARLGLGRSFQDARLFPALTVAQTIALAFERQVDVKDPIAAALNLPVVAESEKKIREKVDHVIDLMGLDAYRDKFVSELSTGSRRIVDLGCVVAHDPKVLLFDEPSSGIAQKETEALGPLLMRIREETGASLLVIEHDMPLITSIADEIIALDLGTFVTQGEPIEVVNHPQVVASYLGTADQAIARSGALAPAKSATARSTRRRSTRSGTTTK
jgi:branched-chain amino acid transport system ATP-binding protein